MLSIMERLQYTYLMMFCCFTLVSIHGKDNVLFPSCEVGLMVQRGTVRKTSPQQLVTVKCNVKHCGESFNITWCKLSSMNYCEQINKTESVEITQTISGDNLISYLTFKQISIYDDGLYQCGLKDKEISHFINISVSDLNKGIENSDRKAFQALNSPPRAELSWLPYFYICISIALLAAAVTVLTHLSFHSWKKMMNYKPTNGQEMPRSMIPDLPKRSEPTTPVLQPKFYVMNDIYYPSTTETPLSPSYLITNANQPLAYTTNQSQMSDCAVYSVISHTQSPARKHHTATKKSEYATISVS